MDFLRRRSKAEFVVIAALVLVITGSYLIWTALLVDSDGTEDPDNLVVAAQETLTALASAPEPTSTSPATPTLMPAPVAWNGICTPDSFVSNLPVDVPASDPSYPDWYGSRDAGLWVAPLYRNTLLPQLGSLSNERWFAGATSYLMWYGTTEPITVTGRQLDAEGEFESSDPPSMNPQVRAQWTTFEIPRPGCWEITGRAGDLELTVVAEVMPFGNRPDVVATRQMHAAIPYPPPASCATTPWAGPEARHDAFIATYWLEDAATGIAASDQLGWLLAEQRSALLVTGVTADEDFSASIQRDSNPGTREAVTNIERRNADRLVRATFPEPGCWTLNLTAGTRTASFVVYVYPAGCMPDVVDGEFVALCSAP